MIKYPEQLINNKQQQLPNYQKIHMYMKKVQTQATHIHTQNKYYQTSREINVGNK